MTTPDDKFTRSYPAPADAATMNSEFWSKSVESRMAKMHARDTVGVCFQSGNGILNYLFALHPILKVSGEAEFEAGTLSDSTSHISPAKVDASIYGYTSRIVKKPEANPKAIVGPEILKADSLMGTGLQEGDEWIFVSMPSAFMVPAMMEIIRGTTTDLQTMQDFANLGKDQEAWINHIEISWTQKSIVDKVFGNIAGEEQKFVASTYTQELWPSSAPNVDVMMVAPEDIPSAWPVIKATIGIDRAVAAAAGAAAAARPTTVTLVREDDAAAKEEQGTIRAQFHTMFMCADIDWQARSITNLRAPTFSDAFEDALGKKSVDARVRDVKVAWMSVIHAEEDNPYNVKVAFDPNRAYLSLVHMSETLFKLLMY